MILFVKTEGTLFRTEFQGFRWICHQWSF